QVAFRRALTHPALPRPVAYLGGHELAPLTELLRGELTLAEALLAWSRSMPAEQAMAVAAWLHGRDLLVYHP
ncbi:hypothetical protein, partial [Kitasatospora sp. NPDC093558]|uniref:hypothetical protein n=1 Tax=Kitasatospora sp. NPDC093558 TaxID=3155201 RepID=UPI0034401F19